MGQSRPGRSSSRSNHVRCAPKAEVSSALSAQIGIGARGDRGEKDVMDDARADRVRQIAAADYSKVPNRHVVATTSGKRNTGHRDENKDTKRQHHGIHNDAND